jgi:hypothetical protein
LVLSGNSINYRIKKRQKHKTTQNSFSLAREFRNAWNICNFPFRNCCSLTTWPWGWKNDIPSKHRGMITQHHIVTSSYHNSITSRMRTKKISLYLFFNFIYFLRRSDPTRARGSSFTRFLDHTQRLTTTGKTTLDEWSARRRDLYLIAHNTHNGQIIHGIRTHNLSRRATADLRLRPRGRWDWLCVILEARVRSRVIFFTA